MSPRIFALTLTTGIIVIVLAATVALMAPIVMGAPNTGPCPDGSTSCLDSPYWEKPPADSTPTQQAMYCFGRVLSNEKYGTQLPIPAWCNELDRTSR